MAVALIASWQAMPVHAETAITIPKPRPTPTIADLAASSDPIKTASISAKPSRAESNFVIADNSSPIKARAGSLKKGLEALDKRDMQTALAIRAGMPAGSLDRILLAWSIALRGKGASPGTLAKIAADIPDWPAQKAIQSNIERSIVRNKLGASQTVRAFGSRTPRTVGGAIHLTSALLAKGQTSRAKKTIRWVWRNENLERSEERVILKKFSKLLTREDHKYRVDRLLYDDRARAAGRIAGLAGATRLVAARTAVIRKSSKANKALNAVPRRQQSDPGYLFSKMQHLRRAKKYRAAAKIVLKAPKAQAKLVDPDEWWVERRILSRNLLDQGDKKLAYRVAAGHSAKSRSKRAEAEFHAGWYALRYLNDPAKARPHFKAIMAVSTRPISLARAHYWLGRTAEKAGNRSSAETHYRDAAVFGSTYYGQLSARKLKRSSVGVSKPKPSPAERQRFASRKFVKAINRLEAVGYGWRAKSIYRHLAKRLNSTGELALLAARAERQGDYTLSLQIGKISHGRGLDVDTLAFPLGAIPSSAKISSSKRALAYAIARQESAFNVGAVSPANARGLLQLLPGTAKAMARKKGIKYSSKRLVRDGGYNATLGVAYLEEQIDNFSGSLILTFVGYNAGPRRAREWIKKFGDPRGRNIDFVVDWVERVPFTETRNYIQRVMENYQVYRARIDGAKLAIERDLRRGRRG